MTLIDKVKRNTASVLASALTLVAVFFVNVASPVYVYSGDTPEELLK
ncbi:cyclic lactone autoinducer peptide [Paenibacillus uliginis N3/975]|uniref:Cyclic lactone autoinducer peptide n=1 Tax=Paenibacillus uliginis N3/975 TaxID=1313296 RepID=A0A1X7HLD9_9BACL|nr:cyclic lactone autoinducer peptide [Paenibacillus uliginis]SMF88210.1 cyclic lactone autoinducer peptide [Paenibacillus uliginis N3/975]